MNRASYTYIQLSRPLTHSLVVTLVKVTVNRHSLPLTHPLAHSLEHKNKYRPQNIQPSIQTYETQKLKQHLLLSDIRTHVNGLKRVNEKQLSN